MPSDYQWALFFHILGVAALSGGVTVSVATFGMMRRSKTVQEVRVWGGIGRILGQYHLIPLAALELVLSGAYLVDLLNHDWSEGWIAFSLLGVVIAVMVGYAVITPRMQAIGMTAGPAPDGPVPEALARRLGDPVLVGAVAANVAMMLAIVWNMTTQPETAISLLAILGALALGLAAAGLSSAPRRMS